MPGPASDPSVLAPSLRDAALRWIADDPDPGTRTELQRVLAAAMVDDAAAVADLADRMAAPLRFGTAGLRGPVRAGPAGMNVAVVLRTTAGLATWLDGPCPESAARTPLTAHDPRGIVVVGRDARHGSAEFGAAAAAVLTAAGFDVRVLPEPLPTPVLAFAVRRLGAVAGIQITASHNPAADNGYKVYLGAPRGTHIGAVPGVGAGPSIYPEGPLADPSTGGSLTGPEIDGPLADPSIDTAGAQLVGPADAEIEAAIDAAPPAVAVPTAAGARSVDVDMVEDYLDRVGHLPRGTARELRVALTPLHGVGGATAVHALRRAGFTDVHVVASQARPDPAFPTVAFPNPEEPGATDALLALARDVRADLAVALDPDADRCALGVPLPDGTWRMLTGDETGVLLGDHLLAAGGYDDPLVATTIVSSSQLRLVAAARGARYAETLTGFKWIVRAGPGLVYGYEEALGYCVDPGAVLDKDGIAAAVLACDLAAGLRACGATLLDRLDALAVEHGVHATEGLTVATEPSARDATMAGLVAAPPAGWAVEHPAPDVAVLHRAGERVVVRPSGTEPKLKVYLQVVEPVLVDQHGGALERARADAARRLDALRAQVRAMLE